MPDPKPDRTAFLAEARERYKADLEADKIDRDEAAEDVRFAAGDQWDPDAAELRRKSFRPVLTWNRLQTFTARVVNDGRRSKPAIKCAPLDGGTKETAEFYQGRIRHIEYESSADQAYDSSREQQVVSGRGFYRLTTKYRSNDSFEQELRIEPIENQFSVLFDAAAKEYDRSDADHCFVITKLSREEFRRKYGKETEVAHQDFYSDQQNPAPDWINVGKDGQQVQIAEYWVREHRKRTLCRLTSGETAFEDELPEGAVPAVDEAGKPITRVVDDCKVIQYVINGIEVLDETEWKGSWIPILPLWGRELYVEGRLRTYSLIRFAKDPQRSVNVYVSNIAELIGQMPKALYMAAEGQILPQFAGDWATANVSPVAYLTYKAIDVNGHLVGAPQRISDEPPIQALTLALNQAIDGIKSAMGIFDASMGAKGNETSGIAIQRRQSESDTSNYHFHDNEARTRKHLGQMLLELIPIVDAGEHEVTVRAEDGTTRAVKVNTAEPYMDPETGEQVHHRLDKGNYGVAITTGPSYNSQREQAFDIYSQVANADKNFMGVAGDLLFQNLDAPGADQIAERYKKLLPPQLQEQKPGQAQQIPPQVQAAMQQAQQLIGALTDQLNAAKDELNTRGLELETRLKIAELQEETKRSIALAQVDSAEAVILLKTQVQRIESELGHLREIEMQGRSQAAAQEAAAAQQKPGEQPAAANQQPAEQEQPVSA